MACAKARFFRGGSYAPKRLPSTFSVPGSVPRRSRARTGRSAGRHAASRCGGSRSASFSQAPTWRRTRARHVRQGRIHFGPPTPRCSRAAAAAEARARARAAARRLVAARLGERPRRARGAGARHLDSPARRAVAAHAAPRLARLRRRAPGRAPRRVPQRPLRRRFRWRDLGRARPRRPRRRRRLGPAGRQPGSRRRVRAPLPSGRYRVHAVLSPGGHPARLERGATSRAAMSSGCWATRA